MSLTSINCYHDRIILSTYKYDSKANRGIKTHNFLTKIFVDLFGTGIVKAKINGKTFYLNKGSCFKLINNAKLDKSSVAYKAFKNKSNHEIIQNIQQVLDDKNNANLINPDAQQLDDWVRNQDMAMQAFYTPLNPVQKLLFQLFAQPHSSVPSNTMLAKTLISLLGPNIRNIRSVPGHVNLYALELIPGKAKNFNNVNADIKYPHAIEVKYFPNERKWKIFGDVICNGNNVNGTTYTDNGNNSIATSM